MQLSIPSVKRFSWKDRRAFLQRIYVLRMNMNISLEDAIDRTIYTLDRNGNYMFCNHPEFITSEQEKCIERDLRKMTDPNGVVSKVLGVYVG